MTATIIVAVIAALLAIPALWDWIRRADLRRIGLRNVVRRPTESLLIIVGSALATAIIAAAFMVGDTFDTSIRDIARVQLGEVDTIIDIEDPTRLDQAVETIRTADVEGVDGVMGVRTIQAAIASDASGQTLAEPVARVLAIDLAEVTAFGTDPAQWGLRGAPTALAIDEVLLNQRTADEVGAVVGDTVTVHSYGAELSLTVAGVVERIGFGGFGDAFVSLDLIDAVAPGADGPDAAVLVSNEGTVFDSVDVSDNPSWDQFSDMANALAADGFVWDLDPAKRGLLRDAEAEGSELRQIFSVVGGFSVVAGVLLLINLFVMLSEERKPTLGVLRAIGWTRRRLRRAFALEGLVYAVVAAVTGAVLGIGVGWVIVRVTRNILGSEDPDGDFSLVFDARPSSLVLAALVGLVIAMGAVRFTSWRISRLNIISAIRELPEPPSQRSTLVRLSGGALMIVAGGAALALGISTDNPFLTIIGVPVAILGAAVMLSRTIPPMALAGVGGLLVVLWGGVFFPVMPDAMTADIEITFFLVFGVVVVAGGVALASVAGPLLQKLLGRTERPMVEAQVGLAYPMARRFRTASSLAMYSLIIFSLAFMAVLSNGLAGQVSDFTTGSALGHDVLVTANASDPMSVAELEEVDGVRQANGVVREVVQWTSDLGRGDIRIDEWTVSGASADLVAVGAPRLNERAERFATDAEAFAAVAASDDLILVPTWFLDADDGAAPQVGGSAMAQFGTAQRSFEIVGVVDVDYAFSGVWMSSAALADFTGADNVRRFYVETEAGADAALVADRIEGSFVTNGAQAESFEDRIQRFVNSELGFFSLLRGYLMLGLIIGIAGLAVTLWRAVRERRRQIGMLRAMGLAAGGVRRWFLTEASFVSVLGIVTGVGLGVLTSWLMITRSSAFDESVIPFGIPWVTLAFIVGIPLVASAAAAMFPARRAASLLPAEALRLAD